MSNAESEKQKRIENYESIRTSMENNGFTEKICTISVLKANLMALVTSGPIAIICLILFFIKCEELKFELDLPNTFLFVLFMFISIVVHELLHGLTWGFFCKNRWKSIRFGVMWKYLTPYCHCKEILGLGKYILGGLMPLVILGIGLFCAALFTGSLLILSLSVMNILAAGGDVTIALILLKQRKSLILDHPTECGFIAFHR